MTSRSDSIQSVVRAFAVLRVISRLGASVPLGVIAKETELPKSTVSRLLSTMVEIGAVDRVGDGLYSIGGEVRGIVQPAVGIAEMAAVARPYLRELVQHVGEDAGLAVLDGSDVLYVDQISSAQPVQVADWTGRRFPAHATAAGYILLGTLSYSEREDLFSAGLEALTPKTIVTPDGLHTMVRAGLEDGFAYSLESWAAGINGAAAPVRGRDASIVAAISVYGPSYRFPGDVGWLPMMEHLHDYSIQISKHLGSPY